MKKIILDALKAKFEGVSDNVLGRIADKLARTVTTAEQVKAAVDGYTWQQIIESYADSRVTEASQTAVHNYETKHGLKDGMKIDNGGGSTLTPPSQQQPEANKGAQDIPEWAKQMQETNKQLLGRLATMETERTTFARKQKLSELVGRLPEPLRKGYGRIAVDALTDEEFASLTQEVETEVGGIVNELQRKGAVFNAPMNGNRNNTGGELSKEQQDAIAHRDGIRHGEGQPF